MADRASKDEEARTLAIRAPPTLDATRPSAGTLATRWKVTIPGEHANLNVTVDAEDQELVAGGPRYEGSAAVTGTYGHRHVIGSTYIEVTASKWPSAAAERRRGDKPSCRLPRTTQPPAPGPVSPPARTAPSDRTSLVAAVLGAAPYGAAPSPCLRQPCSGTGRTAVRRPQPAETPSRLPRGTP
ncbi:lipocalin family protein [Streptomyces sp. AC550_RSS872]|uniref:lipocalin family protein n=1 Tax=Streptomyces sp. AC550_RSS872 TaxID=2823689 RepID=UPI001C269475|nr:lipocalin family protein [Streptomyces sp. AC550_RSS872]